MRVAVRTLVISAATVLALVAGTGSPAVAAQPAPRPIGTDVSWPLYPDCLRGTQAGAPFALVGVNNGLPTGTNGCLASQLAWAQTAIGTGRPRVEVYVNAANPGDVKASAAWWPAGDSTRAGSTVTHVPGHCSGGNTVACAFVYGYSIATDDLGRVPSGTASRWWIDVETANTWSSRSTARNRAVVEGMAARFAAAHLGTGLYGLPSEVPFLLGAIPAASPLAAVPTWIAGDGDQAAAEHRCAAAPFAKGRVMLAQYTIATTGGELGQDVACGTFSSSPKPHVTGGRLVGTRLTAHAGTWRPSGATLSYRWLRNGSPIDGASHATYRLTRADRGHRVAVTVTASADGYSRGVRTSAAVRVP